MSVKRVAAAEAANLLGQGYKYLDVRSVPEFQQGHPTGAYNIPIAHMLPDGRMAPNLQFDAEVAKVFAKGDKIVVGCAAGVRSLRAAEMMQAKGFTDVIDNLDGMKGWREARLPIEKG